MTRPTVDVVIPCYNYARYLPACLESVLTQNGVAVRVLIIDDASQDASEDVGRAFARTDARVEFVRHSRNQGHVRTYNEGIDWISSDYWLLLSADDLLAPGALARAAAVMDRHPDVGLAYGRATFLRDDEPVSAPEGRFDEGVRYFSGRQFLQYVCRNVNNPVPTPSAVVRTAVQKTIGGYLAELPHTCDMEMWMRIAAHADVCFLSAWQAIYRWHGANMQTQYLRSRLVDLRERHRACQALFAAHGARIAESDHLRIEAACRVAQDAFSMARRAFAEGNLEAVEECLVYAAACDPRITTSMSWRRLRCKTAVGPRLWRLLEPVWKVIRTAPDPQRADTEQVSAGAAWIGGQASKACQSGSPQAMS
jgi:hypothetical protein